MSDNWDLSVLVKDEEEFNKLLDEIKKEIPEFEAFKGKLGQEEELARCLAKQTKFATKLMRVAEFASMRSDLNKKDAKNLNDDNKVSNTFAEFGSAISFMDPEIIGLGEKYTEKFFKDYPECSEYDFTFKKLFHSQGHILDAAKEKILSNFNNLQGEGGQLYSALSVGDRVNGKVTLSDGEEITVTQGNWRNLIADSKDKEDRRKVFESIFSYYEEKKNVYGEIYNTVLNSELAGMKSRNYSSILESHLFNNNIPTSVFTNLIETTSTHTAPLIKYYEIRRKYLGLDKHRSYDRFIQLAKSDKKYSYKEAREMFFKSIEKFPKDFQNKAREASKEGYIDVYEKEGKRSGAYSSGGYGVHPFILLNFDGALDDIFTLAHESGHSIHTLYALENQPLEKQNYTIFVAEIASTFNEHNLLDYLIQSGNLSKEEKIMMLQKSIDDICSTFYRQALFAQFEYTVAQKAEKGEPVNYEMCNSVMVDLYKTYYNIDITEEKVKEYVWAYIPHLFYTPFYVYQYATSFSASYQLYKNVKENKPQAFDKYLGLLKAAGSDYPITEVKNAGVDLTTKEPFLNVCKRMEELVDELEKVLLEK